MYLGSIFLFKQVWLNKMEYLLFSSFLFFRSKERIKKLKSTPFCLIKSVWIYTYISVYISEMRYYVHCLHFSDYYPHLCRNVYLNFSVVIGSSLLQVVGMSNLSLYFAYCGKHICPQGHMAQWIKAIQWHTQRVWVQYPVKAVENFQSGN